MEPLKIDIDGEALKQFLEDTKRTRQGLSREIGCGNGYISNAIIVNRMGRPQYMLMCRILGVDEERFKKAHVPEKIITELEPGEKQVTDRKISEQLEQIDTNLVRLGKIMLDIRELLKEGQKK